MKNVFRIGCDGCSETYEGQKKNPDGWLRVEARNGRGSDWAGPAVQYFCENCVEVLEWLGAK